MNLYEYLKQALDNPKPVIDHVLRATHTEENGISFYIHPLGVDGATLDVLLRPEPGWSKTLPNESGLWWWWNGDEDQQPLVVEIAYSGTDGSYFAMQGQHGWTRFQPVTEMQGYWMQLHYPPPPRE